MPSLLVRQGVGPPHCCKVLRRSVEFFSAAWSASPLCGVLLISFLIFFSALGLPSRYLASFFLILSPCPAKHYNMEDQCNISEYECESCN